MVEALVPMANITSEDHDMQRRSSARDANVLPLVADDTARVPRRKLGKRKGDVYLCGTTFWSIVVGIVLLTLVAFVGNSWMGRDGARPSSSSALVTDNNEQQSLPLAEFETVNYALQHANLVGIYFAASWCPMSTPATKLLKDHFASVPNLLFTGEAMPQKHSLSIVHVSSDNAEADMIKYVKDANWITVPFDSQERTELKKHFQVCAKPEVTQLGIERKFEIPSLLIIDGKTHGLISTNGVKDLEERGPNALDHWMELQQLIRGLESKYS